MPVFTRPVKDAPVWDTFDSWATDSGVKYDLSFPGPVPNTQPVRQRTMPTRQAAIVHQPISILFVDERNRVRSVIAHAQAEITRLWTLNQRGYNLFSAVDSAGLHVETSLTRKGNWHNHRPGESAQIEALEAVMGEPLYKEGQDLKTRFLDKHRTRGIEYEDFDKFDYILAFDESTLTDLRNLEWVAYRRARSLGKDGLRAKTKYIGDFNTRYSGAVRIPKPETGRVPARRDFAGTVGLVEQELHNFLRSVTRWTKPDRIALEGVASRYRSRHFLARRTRVTDAKLRTMRLLHQKRVMVDEEVVGREYRTVTVTAKEGHQLREALEDARAAFL